MRSSPKLLILCGLSLAGAAHADGVSLMQTISEWQYPGSTLLGGASMGDGGNPSIPSANCKAVLTTPDPVSKVIAFYEGKFGAGKPGIGSPKGAGQSVSVLDDSEGRPVTLRVIVVNRRDTSTTLVVSRAEGESKTHIAWSHHIRLGAGDRQQAGADARMRVSLSLYSGEPDPSWEASAGEIASFTARFDALKAREAQQPLGSTLGYRGFFIDGFRDYDRVQVWRGTVEATRDGKTYRWNDEGRSLERDLLKTSRPHVNDHQYEEAASKIDKK